jgi:hypothetical protein
MFGDDLAERLVAVARRLVPAEGAQLLVEPRAAEQGFWFGGGNICRDADGSLLLCGRYRNGGDSRSGIEAGPRGAEIAVLRSTDGGERFEHVLSLLKPDVAPEGREVLSIEGCCLRRTESGLELYVSSEKRADYPDRLRGFQKPGTGVWSIDVLGAPSVEALAEARPEPVLAPGPPAWLHVKDPVLFELGGSTWMTFCSHPYSWTSSNTGLARQGADGAFQVVSWGILPRGTVWDVAVTRVTARLRLPAAGVLREGGPVALYFYDGAECMHDHGRGGRPRGYSCEELGGLAAGRDGEFPRLERLSVERPLLVSPHATGCNRYVSAFEDDERYVLTWQRAAPDGSQPLVVNRVPRSEVAALLGA